MRSKLALIALFALWGCAPAAAAGLVPRVAVRGAIVERRGVDRVGTDWRVDVDAVWTLDRPVPVARRRSLPPARLESEPGGSPRGAALPAVGLARTGSTRRGSSDRGGALERRAPGATAPPPIACVVPAICTWERRARVRATRRLRPARGGR